MGRRIMQFVVVISLMCAYAAGALAQELTEDQKKAALDIMIAKGALKRPLDTQTPETSTDILKFDKYNVAFDSNPVEQSGAPLKSIVGPLEAGKYEVIIQCVEINAQGTVQHLALHVGQGPTLSVNELDVAPDPDGKPIPVCGGRIPRIAPAQVTQSLTGFVRKNFETDTALFSYTEQVLDLEAPIAPTTADWKPVLVVYVRKRL